MNDDLITLEKIGCYHKIIKSSGFEFKWKKYHIYHSHYITHITSIFIDGAGKSEETAEMGTNSSEVPQKKIVEVCTIKDNYFDSYCCINLVSLRIKLIRFLTFFIY